MLQKTEPNAVTLDNSHALSIKNTESAGSLINPLETEPLITSGSYYPTSPPKSSMTQKYNLPVSVKCLDKTVENKLNKF